MKKASPLKGDRKYHIVRTIGRDYAISRIDSDSPWPERWGFRNYEEARQWVKKLNSGRYKLGIFSKELKKVI